ncbi:MAG: hypothetical protein IIX91_02050, partial [Clostridia bacterium]|nr:hypothetical protein [Clostridia bacterium]
AQGDSLDRALRARFNYYQLRRSRAWNRRFSAAWNHHEVMYGINPKWTQACAVIPYAFGDAMLGFAEMPYQSFGLVAPPAGIRTQTRTSFGHIPAAPYARSAAKPCGFASSIPKHTTKKNRRA